jgi:hypothetical protein
MSMVGSTRPDRPEAGGSGGRSLRDAAIERGAEDCGARGEGAALDEAA